MSKYDWDTEANPLDGETPTPGPWLHEGQGYIRSTSPRVSPAGSRICVVKRNVEANARLIIAAPDMLDVCKSALVEFIGIHEVMLLDPCNEGMKEAEIIGKLRDVIAKAEGRSQPR